MNFVSRKPILAKLPINKGLQGDQIIEGSASVLTKSISYLVEHIMQIVQEQKKTNDELKKITEQQQKTNGECQKIFQKIGKQLKVSNEQFTYEKQGNNFDIKNHESQLLPIQNRKYNSHSPNQYVSNRMEPRLQNIDYPVLEKISVEKIQRRSQIVNWVGDMLKVVFSIGFNLFKNEDIEENKYKAFCSENILRNLISFSRVHNITQDEVESIDKCLVEEFMPYFKLKYPETEEQSTSRELEQLLIPRDSIGDNEHDLVYKSGVKFNYNKDGDYSSEIMEFLNYVIALPNEEVNQVNIFNREPRYQSADKVNKYEPKDMKNKIAESDKMEENQIKSKTTLKRSFFAQVDTFFKMVQDQSQVIQMHKFNPKVNEQQKSKLSGPQNNKQLQQKQIDEKERQKYREKVQSYTSFQIGQKLGDENSPFSSHDITSGTLKLNSSAMMRVMTKWCEELEDCFNKKNILKRETPFRMENGEEKYFSLGKARYLNYLLEREKKQIEKQLEQLKQNNYFHQSTQLNAETLPQILKFSEDEAMVGQFSSFMLKNNQIYLLMYVNLLIHGIKKACKNFSDFMTLFQRGAAAELDQGTDLQSCYDFISGQLKKQQVQRVNFASQTPELITFKIGDLLRCKCSSKENEIVALYKQIERINMFHPDHFRIIRIKNRLASGNKDILMNIVYKNTMVVEMQLAVKQQKSKFIEHSNKFNHYFYELKRAKFGAIMEMCSMWMSQDSRASFYKDVHQQEQKVIEKNSQKQLCCPKPDETVTLLPFVCRKCKNHYFDCNGRNQHTMCINCRKCICSNCRFEQASTWEEKIKLRPEIKQLKTSNQNKVRFYKEIPKNGVLFDLSSKVKAPVSFTSIEKDNKVYVFENQGKLSKPIYEFKKDEVPQSFFKEVIISTTTIYKIDRLRIDAEMNNYFVQKYLDDCSRSQKTSIYLAGEGVTKQLLEANSNKVWPNVKKMNLSENKLEQLDDCVAMFPNVEMALLNRTMIVQAPKAIWSKIKYLYLSQNYISDVSLIYDCLQLLELDISKNKIQRIDQNIGKLVKMQRLWLNDNKICQIAVEISNMKNLRLLNISNNKQLQVLSQIFVDMKNLQSFSFEDINVEQLPNQMFIEKDKMTNLKINKLKSLKKVNESIVNLTKLQNLYLGDLTIEKLPQDFGNLPSLSKLSIQKLMKLNCLPESLGNLTNLKQISITLNSSLISIPQSLGNLSTLQNLSINNYRQLKLLPDTLGNLSSLKKLSLNIIQKMQYLPQSLSKLTSLQQFIFMYNKFVKNLPESFGNLSNLKKLHIRQIINLSSLPNSFCNLTSLQHFTLSRCTNFTSLPDNFGNLSSLRALKIYQLLQLKCLPQSFGNLSSLKQLNLQFCTLIQNLPQSFGNLSSLQQLSITQFPNLTCLPQSFGNLTALTKLKISHNQKLISLSQNFGNLRSLRQLVFMQSSRISGLPNSFGNLISLQELNIFKCQDFTQLPQSFGNLLSLQKLNLTETINLTRLPESFGNLSSLARLTINKNLKLTSLPQSFGNLSSLKYIYLYQNQTLKSLPESFGNLSSLQQLIFQRNTQLQSLPASFVKLQKTLKKLFVDRIDKVFECIPKVFQPLLDNW